MTVNGKLSTTNLYGGHRLRADAAAAWARLIAAYGKQIKITDSYRPYEVQERIFLQRYMPRPSGGGTYGDVRYWKGVRYVRKHGTAAAAVPGTSNHGWGLALDLADGVNSGRGPAWEWLQKNAERFGWHNPDWAKQARFYEPWHWEYDPALDKSEPAAEEQQSNTTDPEPEKEKPDMHVIHANGGRYALVSGGRAIKLSAHEYQNYKSVGVVAVKLSDSRFDQIVKEWK